MENSNSRKRLISDDEIKVLEPILVRLNRNGVTTHDIRIDKPEFRIGRARDNDEIILDTVISRKHCVIRYEGNGEWTLKDLSSSFTLVNNNVLKSGSTCKIFVGDIIQFSVNGDYKYVFTLNFMEQNVSKRQCIDDKLINNVLMEQKTFITNQENQRKELKNKIKTKQKEQFELKQQLEGLIKQQDTTKGDKKHLKSRITKLENKIEEGNDQEKHLQYAYSLLLEKLENERTQFEARLEEEKKKWQEALDVSKQEKESLEIKMKEQMEKWREEQQTEWKNVMENRVKEEKDIQAQLLIEKIKLEEKLKEIEKALKDKETKLESVQPKHEPGTSAFPEESCIVVEILANSNMHSIETIDLTESNVQNDAAPEGVMDKVSNIMEEQLTCSVCSELFIKATTLNCTHTFCLHCINTWNKKSKECPICRASIKSMNRSLVLDNFIDNMLENFPAQIKEKRSNVIEERKALGKKRSGRKR